MASLRHSVSVPITRLLCSLANNDNVLREGLQSFGQCKARGVLEQTKS